MNGHSPKAILGFTGTAEPIRKLDVPKAPAPTMLLPPLVLYMGLNVLGKLRAARSCFRLCQSSRQLCASVPGDRSESGHLLCQLFILPLQIPQQPEEMLPCREAAAASCTGKRAKGQSAKNMLNSLYTPVISLTPLE